LGYVGWGGEGKRGGRTFGFNLLKKKLKKKTKKG
jgi:hypothetical protein